jgi:hypothetical protein
LTVIAAADVIATPVLAEVEYKVPLAVEAPDIAVVLRTEVTPARVLTASSTVPALLINHTHIGQSVLTTDLPNVAPWGTTILKAPVM